MNAKITLYSDKELIEKIKKYAKEKIQVYQQL